MIPKAVDNYRMTLGEHFEELRRSLLRAVLGVVVGMSLCVALGDWIMQIMTWPLVIAQRRIGMPVQLQALAPTESFAVYLKVCLIWGLILAAPYSLWQIWRFVASGLYPKERGYVHRSVPLSIVLFISGVLFFFIVVSPIMLSFLLEFGRDRFPRPKWGHPISVYNPAPLTPTTSSQPSAVQVPVLPGDPEHPSEGDMWINAQDEPGRIRIFLGGAVRVLDATTMTFLNTQLAVGFYMTFISATALVFGLCFQVPVVVLVLARTGLVPLERLRKVRKFVMLAVVIIAAVITPTGDPLNLMILAVPMYLLYELGLILARFRKTRTAREAT